MAPRLRYTRRRRNEHSTRRAGHAEQRSAARGRHHGLTPLRRFKVRALTKHAIDSRVADVLQSIPWAQLAVLLAQHRRDWQPSTTTFPKLVMSDSAFSSDLIAMVKESAGAWAPHSIVWLCCCTLQNSKSGARYEAATREVHFPGQSTCISTTRPGTVELQRPHILRFFPRAVE